MSVPNSVPADSAPPPAAQGPLIALADVDVSFHGLRVLRGISLGIPRGQTLVVIGESG